MSDVRMNVWKVLYDSTVGSSVVLLTDGDETQILPIWIGQPEALSIAIALEKIEIRRPMTHDLLKKFVDAVNLELEWVRINDIREGTFYATIRLTGTENHIELDCRPSDAIALAVRAEVPIFVSEKVLVEALGKDFGAVDSIDNLEEDFLENLPDEIFGKYKM